MVKAISIVFLLALTGCSGVRQQQATASPCSAGEASPACQVERYQKVNMH